MNKLTFHEFCFAINKLGWVYDGMNNNPSFTYMGVNSNPDIPHCIYINKKYSEDVDSVVAPNKIEVHSFHYREYFSTFDDSIDFLENRFSEKL